MMQHSFMEFGSQSVNDKHRKELQKLENIQVSIPDRVKNLLFEFYDTALDYIEIWNKTKVNFILFLNPWHDENYCPVSRYVKVALKTPLHKE